MSINGHDWWICGSSKRTSPTKQNGYPWCYQHVRNFIQVKCQDWHQICTLPAELCQLVTQPSRDTWKRLRIPFEDNHRDEMWVYEYNPETMMQTSSYDTLQFSNNALHKMLQRVEWSQDSLYKIPKRMLWRRQHQLSGDSCCYAEINLVRNLLDNKTYVQAKICDCILTTETHPFTVNAEYFLLCLLSFILFILYLLLSFVPHTLCNLPFNPFTTLPFPLSFDLCYFKRLDKVTTHHSDSFSNKELPSMNICKNCTFNHLLTT